MKYETVADFDLRRFAASGCDPALILACQAGDREARGEFFRKYRSDVARVASRILGHAADVDDAVQDAFVEIFRSIPSFRGDSRITTWLYRIATNVALQKLRRRRRSREEPTAAPDEPVHHTPEREAAAREAARHVYRILDQLSPKKRVVFVLHEIEGMDASEIARVVGSNPLTVRTRLHYARKEFYRLAMMDRLLDRREAS